MTPNSAIDPNGPQDISAAVAQNAVLPHPDKPETLKEKIQQKALLGLAQCARGYLSYEKKETFEIGPDGEKILRGTVVTRKRVGPDLAAIQFILTNLNPSAWQLKPTAVSLPPEEDPDLSALSVQTLKELAGWIQKNPSEENTVFQTPASPNNITDTTTADNTHTLQPTDPPIPLPPTEKNPSCPSLHTVDSSPFQPEDTSHEKNECPRSIEPATPETPITRPTAPRHKIVSPETALPPSSQKKRQQPDSSRHRLITSGQRELPFSDPPELHDSHENIPTFRLPSRHSPQMA